MINKKMNTQQIWDYLYSNKVAISHPFDRDFIWVTKQKFQEIATYFMKEYNPMHKEKSYRSGAYFKHIHAVEKDQYIFVHFDHGNPRKFPPIVILHFFIDVMPYFIFCFLKRVRFDYYFVPPLNK